MTSLTRFGGAAFRSADQRMGNDSQRTSLVNHAFRLRDQPIRMKTRGSPETNARHVLPMRARFSLSSLPIKYRLPLIVAGILFGVILISIWISYRSVKESAVAVGRERLFSLTLQLANQTEQSLPLVLGRTFSAANEPAIRAFLQSPSAATRPAAVAVLQQFNHTLDPSSVQVELWNANAVVLIEPSSAPPETADLDIEFKQSATDPFKAAGPIRVVKGLVVYAAVAAVKDEAGKPIGFLVRWRRVSSAQNVREQVADLLVSQGALYYGNTRGDIFTDLEKIVPKPPVHLSFILKVAHYSRDGNSVMALGRPINGTPWYVVVEFPDQMFLTQANTFLRQMVLIGSILFTVGVVGSFALASHMTRRLRLLTKAASAMGRGDYCSLVAVRGNDDELDQLANAFNFMLVKVWETQLELERQMLERTACFEAAPNAMLMIDEQGRMTLVNAQLEQLFGYQRAELLNQPVKMLVPERYRTAHQEHGENLLSSLSARAMGADRDLYGRRKDGTEVPIEVRLNPIRTNKGAFVASIIDITERKRGEHAL